MSQLILEVVTTDSLDGAAEEIHSSLAGTIVSESYQLFKRKDGKLLSLLTVF